MTDDFTGMPTPMPRPEVPPRCPTCGLPMWPAAEYGPHLCPPGFQDQPPTPKPSEVADDLTDAERIGVAVAAMVSGITEARDQARAIAVELEQDLAEAVRLLKDARLHLEESTWASDTTRADSIQAFLEGLGSSETPDETKDGH